jgi:hypothetical protein
MIKQQILVKLQTKFAGLPKKFLELLAEKLAKKVQDESGIDDAIATLDNAPISVQDLAADFLRYGDSRVTDAEREWLKKNQKQGNEEDDEDDGDDDGDDESNSKPKPKTEKRKRSNTGAPKWARDLQEEIRSLRTEKVQGTFKEKLKERLKDVPESFYKKWKLPENEAELETFVSDAETEYLAFTQDLKNNGVAGAVIPIRNTDTSKGGTKVADKVIQSSIDRYVERNLKKPTTETKTDK